MSVRPIAAGNSIFYHSVFTPCILVWVSLIYVSTFGGAERTSLPEVQQNTLNILHISASEHECFLLRHISRIIYPFGYTPGWTDVMWRFYSSFHNWHNTGLFPCTNMSTKLLFQASSFAIHLLLPQNFYHCMWLKALNICKELSLQTWHIWSNWKKENSTACVLRPSQWQVGGV